MAADGIGTGGVSMGDQPGAPKRQTSTGSAGGDLDCCICLETALYPVDLPCSHKFCYLCIKGCYQTDQKCPLCRQSIPAKYIEKPKLLRKKSLKRSGSTSKSSFGKKKRPIPSTPMSPSSSATPSGSSAPESLPVSPTQVWFYQGRNGGWWQYDERTGAAIDEAVAKGENSLETVIAGNIYVLDLVGKVQILKNNPAIKRNMKQDSSLADSKGIAGLEDLGKKEPASAN